MDSRGKKRQRIRSEKNSSETFSRAASKKQNPIFRRIFHETKKNNHNWFYRPRRKHRNYLMMIIGTKGPWFLYGRKKEKSISSRGRYTKKANENCTVIPHIWLKKKSIESHGFDPLRNSQLFASISTSSSLDSPFLYFSSIFSAKPPTREWASEKKLHLWRAWLCLFRGSNPKV